MGRRTREHTVKIFQIKDGEIIKGEFTCTHQDHAMESIKSYGDYYIEVYDIVGNLIHSENKHIIEPIIEEPIIEPEDIIEVVETIIIPEPKIVKKAPAKKAPAKKTIKKAN